MLLKGIIQSHEFMFKQTCWFIFLFHQEAPLWVSDFKFSSARCSPSLNSELGRSLFLGWDWTWGFWSRVYFPGCVQSCWPHECLHRRVTGNVSLPPLHSPPSALPFYSHTPSQLPMSRTSPKIPLVHICLSEGLHVTSGWWEGTEDRYTACWTASDSLSLLLKRDLGDCRPWYDLSCE